MNLVIPYKDDRNNGFELKYSIRSIVKHFHGLTGVCLIGDKPTWYTGEHIPMTDITGRKEWSIVSKILSSPYEDFLYSTDDHFATEPFDSSLPNYYSGPLSKAIVHGKYETRVKNTRSIYKDGLFYDIHTPMVINLTKFKEAHNIDWANYEYLSKSIYGNYIGGGELLSDSKVRRFGEVPSGRFFSTNNRTAQSIDFETMYPEPSPYESI